MTTETNAPEVKTITSSVDGETQLPVETTIVSADETKPILSLPDKSTLKDVIAKVNELVARANTKRDRGPDSTRTMTEDDAKRIMLGDLKDMSHTKAAEALGLSYGQVYSARKGFTFKPIYKAMGGK